MYAKSDITIYNTLNIKLSNNQIWSVLLIIDNAMVT